MRNAITRIERCFITQIHRQHRDDAGRCHCSGDYQADDLHKFEARAVSWWCIHYIYSHSSEIHNPRRRPFVSFGDLNMLVLCSRFIYISKLKQEEKCRIRFQICAHISGTTRCFLFGYSNRVRRRIDHPFHARQGIHFAAENIWPKEMLTARIELID